MRSKYRENEDRPRCRVHLESDRGDEGLHGLQKLLLRLVLREVLVEFKYILDALFEMERLLPWRRDVSTIAFKFEKTSEWGRAGRGRGGRGGRRGGGRVRRRQEGRGGRDVRNDLVGARRVFQVLLNDHNERSIRRKHSKCKNKVTVKGNESKEIYRGE